MSISVARATRIVYIYIKQQKKLQITMNTEKKLEIITEILFTSPAVIISILVLLAGLITSQGIANTVYAQNLSQNEQKNHETTEYSTFIETSLLRANNSTYGRVNDTIQAKVTGYNTLEAQTDDTPCIGASGDNICGRKDVVACPRKFELGTIVEIDGKKYHCLDRLAKKYDDRFDISCDKDTSCPAKVTGIKNVTIHN